MISIVQGFDPHQNPTIDPDVDMDNVATVPKDAILTACDKKCGPDGKAALLWFILDNEGDTVGGVCTTCNTFYPGPLFDQLITA